MNALPPLLERVHAALSARITLQVVEVWPEGDNVVVRVGPIRMLSTPAQLEDFDARIEYMLRTLGHSQRLNRPGKEKRPPPEEDGRFFVLAETSGRGLRP